MTIHRLKTWTGSFEAILAGHKRHELRLDDRDFNVGDTLVLCEWMPAEEEFTGREIEFEVTYITGQHIRGQIGMDPAGIEVEPMLRYGLKSKWIVMSLRQASRLSGVTMAAAVRAEQRLLGAREERAQIVRQLRERVDGWDRMGRTGHPGGRERARRTADILRREADFIAHLNQTEDEDEEPESCPT